MHMGCNGPGRGSLLVLGALATACGSGGPAIEPLEDRVAAVGEELVLEIQAGNSDGSPITFSYDGDAPDIENRASLSQRPGGAAVFTWTPMADDVGTWTFDFNAIDARGKSTESIVIEVRSAIGANTMPTFLRPLGAGTALDMDREECVEIDIEVEDQDTASLTLVEQEPLIAGAELQQSGDTQAIWRWCPDEEQVVAKDRYVLTIGADDGENPLALKHYQIILRHGDGETCRGIAPLVDHEPQEITGVADIPFEARIVDAGGLKAPPVFYYSLTPPGSPPDLDAMTQLQMELVSGDAERGSWQAIVPSLIAQSQEASRTLYYAIVADDNDDKGGTCDHVAVETYEAPISRSQPAGGKAQCESCSASAECGASADLCMPMGQSRAGFCTLSCDAGGGCPDGYTCSTDELLSVDGIQARQCIPITGACPTSQCQDDELEPNGTLETAAPASAFDEGVAEDLVLCPVADLTSDEDWFEVTITEESFLNFYIAGDLEDDEVDIAMYDSEGTILAKSENWGPSDNVGRCLPPGTYYASVYSYFDLPHQYTIGYQVEPMTCEVSSCEDDLLEEDDDLVFGRVVDLDAGYNATDNKICAGDEDWFYVFLMAGESVYARVEFVQESAYEDLDILLFDGDELTFLTPCSEEDPGQCDPDNGQSNDSNETLRFTASKTGHYYAVVRGFADSENDYDVCISKDAELCDVTP